MSKQYEKDKGQKDAPWKSSVSSSSFLRLAPVLECALLFPPAATACVSVWLVDRW